MSGSTRVCGAGDIAPGTGKCFTVGGKRIAVFNEAGTYRALDDACTHMGASLAEGELAGGAVICPWHGAQFNLHSGAPSGPPARGPVKAYPCRVAEGGVEVEC